MNNLELVELARKVANKKVRLLNGEVDTEWLKFYLGIREGLNPALLVSESNLVEMWDKLRQSEVAQDVLACTTELYFSSGLTQTEWEDRHRQLAYGLSLKVHGHSQDAKAKSYVDTSITDRTEHMAVIAELLHVNHWAVFLLLVSYCDDKIHVNVDVDIENYARTARNKN